MFYAINQKLEDAIVVTLISDIWTSPEMLDFIGLAANITTSAFEKEVVVIGMMRMPGSHCAENIKTSIEAMVNRFALDKSKINGMLHLMEVQHTLVF